MHAFYHRAMMILPLRTRIAFPVLLAMVIVDAAPVDHPVDANSNTDRTVVRSAPIEYYKTKYDHVDVETILNNRRMVNYYSKCLLNQGPCSPDGLEFKRILPDAIRTNCIKCTEKQKAVTIRAIKRLMKEYPKVWAQLQDSWDPDDVYVKKFLDTWSKFEYKPPSTTPAIFNRFGEDDGDKKQVTNTIYNLPPLPTVPSKVLDRVEPFANNIGAGITATVSFGNRVVTDVIRGIGAIGDRVVQTGADIADVVLKNLSKPL